MVVTPSPDPAKTAIPDPLRDFTAAGRLWLAGCITLGVASLGAYVAEVVPELPYGSYPWFIFVLPVAVATVAIYYAGNWLLRKCGVRLRQAESSGSGDRGTDVASRGDSRP